jgi:hypothetical protein
MNDIGKISQQNSRSSQKNMRTPAIRKKPVGKIQCMKNNWLKLTIAAILIVGIGGAVYYYKFSDPGVKSDKFQAVFLADGQVYFGKLSGVNNRYLKMTDVYYLQTNNQADATKGSSEAQIQPSLIKLGSEVHGPEDEMSIRSDKISYWENLKK